MDRETNRRGKTPIVARAALLILVFAALAPMYMAVYGSLPPHLDALARIGTILLISAAVFLALVGMRAGWWERQNEPETKRQQHAPSRQTHAESDSPSEPRTPLS